MKQNARLLQILILLGGLCVGLGLGLLILIFLRNDRPAQEILDLAQAGSFPVAPKAGSPAPDFELETLDGEQLHLQDLLGRPVVINFWATWCIPCEAEMPLLEESYARYPELEILAVNFAESSTTVQTFVDSYDLSFEILLDPRALVQTLYRVRGYPTTYFVDEEGMIRAVHIGVLNQRQLEKYLDQIGVGG